MKNKNLLFCFFKIDGCVNFPYPYIFILSQETLARWHTVFWMAAGINMATNCFYLMFASATEQPWSKGNS